MKRASRRLFASLVGAVLVSGCNGPGKPPPSVAWPALPAERPVQRRAARDTDLDGLRRAPVLDIHTHTFNALYLPLVNIARGRVSELPVAGTVLSETTAMLLAQAIVGATLRNQEAGRMALMAEGPTLRGESEVPFGTSFEDVERARQLRHRLAPAAADEVTKRAEGLPRAQVEALLNDESNWLQFGAVVLGVDAAHENRGGESLTGDRALLRKLGAFIRVLTSADGAVRASLGSAYGQQARWYVHHAMDMGPTYAQASDETFWDYERQQLPAIRRLDAATNGGRFLHFVAFNPFRSDRAKPAHGWEEDRSILLVQRAVANGAWGVKYYPPAGYRPSANIIPEPPRWGLAAGQQWTSRYHGFTAEELDALNLAFFRFCAKNRIPVFAHCGVGEFQAAKGYGVAMAHPAYYRAVLERLAQEKDLPPLRLCFGHAGGASFWFDESGVDRDWGETVFELCTRYPEVYCEVGILSEILQPAARRKFVQRLGDLIAQSNRENRYDFGAKIIYGSDWFMPDAVHAGESFLTAYREAFMGDSRLRSYTEAFLAGNALAYLGDGPEGRPADAAGLALRQWRAELGW
jgi:predicted TIM-barrel fold metal-dependent hydrolase